MEEKKNKPINKPIKGKVILSGEIVCKTGLHIGASDAGLSIGGMDNPVIRDPLTKTPYIPGSSLKGKLRSLLERAMDKEFDKKGGSGKSVIYRHECSKASCKVCRLFGSSSKDNGNIPSRLHVRDAFLSETSINELSELEEGLPYTEWKEENSLDRITCAANPRPIERVPAGAVFEFEIVYTIEKEEDLKDDLNNLQAVLKLLEDDALGGGGSRGNGRVKIEIKDVLVRKKEHYLEGKDEIKVELGGDDLGTSVEKVYRGS